MDDVHWDILEQFESQIREYVDLSGDFGIGGIPDENVTIWQNQYDPREDGADSIHAGDPEVPGVLVSTPTVLSPVKEGENNCDWITYLIVVQIVDRYAGKGDRDRIKLHLRWQRRIHRYFNMNNLRNEISRLHLVYGEKAEVIDQSRFKLSPLAVAAIPFGVQVDQDRDTNGFV